MISAHRIVQSWDIAMMTDDANAYSVCSTWQMIKSDLYCHITGGAALLPRGEDRFMPAQRITAAVVYYGIIWIHARWPSRPLHVRKVHCAIGALR